MQKDPFIISFGLLCNNYFCYGPIHQSCDDKKDIKKILINLINTSDIVFFMKKHLNELNIGDIVMALEENGYYVINYLDKYYTIAFSLNYKRFEIASKHKESKLINWGIPRTLALQCDVVYQISEVEYCL